MSECNKFNIYKNNCNLVFMFNKKKRKNQYNIVLKQRYTGKYKPVCSWTIGGSVQALNKFIYTRIYTQFSNYITISCDQ
jgi:hypothetical protein